MHFDWYLGNLLTGSALCLYFSFVFWTKPTIKGVNGRCLSLIAIVLSIVLIDEFLFVSTISIRYPFLFGLLWPAVFTIGPIFMWYVEGLQDQTFEIGRGQLRHLIPAALSLPALLPFLLLSGEQKVEIITQSSTMAFTPLTLFTIMIVFIGSVLHTGYYVLMALEKAVQHKRFVRGQQIGGQVSDNNLFSRFNSLALSLLGIIFVFAFSAGLNAQLGDRMMVIVQSQMIVVLFVLGCLLVWLHEPTNEVAVEAPLPKYKFSALSAEQGRHYQKQLLKLMQTHKPYRDGNLTLPTLAEQLGISPNYLSQIINERFELSFRDFLNQYRVAEIQQLLLEQPEQTILGLAYDSGFNSKSTFYAAFKKQVGITPSQFRAQHESMSLSTSIPK